MMTPWTHPGSSLSSDPESAEPWRASISAPSFFPHRGGAGRGGRSRVEGVKTNERPVSPEIVRENQPQGQLPGMRTGEATG